MKLILAFITICMIIAASAASQDNHTLKFTSSDSTSYEVYKIDSIKSYYLIYARQGQAIYKIVSKKQKIEKCNAIIINGVYQFKLLSSSYINGEPITPAVSKYEISGIMVDKETSISFEGDSIRDLFFAENVTGLCLLK